jgi:hypothetical protein
MPDDIMTDDQIAFRAAIESQRMPSGLPLEPDAAALHERAAHHLEALVRQLAAEPSADT